MISYLRDLWQLLWLHMGTDRTFDDNVENSCAELVPIPVLSPAIDHI